MCICYWTLLTRNSSFCVNPYLMALVEWRNAMNEEAAALVHASKGMNKALKTVLTISIIFIVSWIEFGGEWEKSSDIVLVATLGRPCSNQPSPRAFSCECRSGRL